MADSKRRFIKEPPATYRAAPSRVLQDAKARFSNVGEAAVARVPQHVTRRGQPTVAILSQHDYARLQCMPCTQATGFIDHLLAIRADALRSNAATLRHAR